MHPILVSLAIFQEKVKVINEVVVQVVPTHSQKGLDHCPCFPVVAAPHHCNYDNAELGLGLGSGSRLGSRLGFSLGLV